MFLSCSSAEKRHNLSYGKWSLKFSMLCFVGKWLLDTYDLVELERSKALSKVFDPYALLHIDADGSFDTKKISNAYHRLAVKYHPDKVNFEKVPREKAVARWHRLQKAYHTLTDKTSFDNYMVYGDPDGSKTF